MAIFTPPSTGTSSPFTSPPVTLSSGDQTILNGSGGAISSAVIAPVVFCVRAGPGRIAPTVALEAQGTATTVTATIQVSMDGGTTWETVASGVNLLTPLYTFTAIPGALYRVNLTTVSGGSATIYAGVS